MEIGNLKIQVEDTLLNPIWPSKWPYSFEDFRPLDYQKNDIIQTQAQYIYSQSLIKSDIIQIIPGLLRVPINRHFIMPKDKIALSYHMNEYCSSNSNLQVLELFSCYDSILPTNQCDTVVGVGKLCIYYITLLSNVYSTLK
jgi:hypothetical protein